MSVFLRPKNPVGNLVRLDFPYTPQIDYSTDVKYDTYNTTHTNYQLYGYTRTENPQINLNCKFSAHTSQHFDLSLFAIRFLRTYSKMNYGRLDDQRGIPPRILRFFAYGEQMFSDVPVVISKFNITFPDDVDYVKGIVSTDGKLAATESVRRSDVPTNVGPVQAAQNAQQSSTQLQQSDIYLPAFFQISISLMVQQNLYKAVNEFKLEDLALGKLGSKGYI
jgi:hypothetical protein